MDFDWLETRCSRGRIDSTAWHQTLREKAALLARLQYPRSKIMNRCHQDLAWTFGEDKRRWPVAAKVIKGIVTDALQNARRGS